VRWGSQMCLNVRWVSIFFVFMQQKFLYHFVVCFCLFTMNANGWGCGKCGRACSVFVPRRKRPSGRNRSVVPMSTHIGCTPCWHTFLLWCKCCTEYHSSVINKITV
jgi:hypothetical protein